MIRYTTTLTAAKGIGKCTRYKGKQIDTSNIGHLPCTGNKYLRTELLNHCHITCATEGTNTYFVCSWLCSHYNILVLLKSSEWRKGKIHFALSPPLPSGSCCVLPGEQELACSSHACACREGCGSTEWDRAWDLAARTWIQGGTLPGGTGDLFEVWRRAQTHS